MQNMFENDLINQSGQSLITICHLCWRQTKRLIVAVTMIVLAGCQPATMSSSSIPATPKTASSPQIQQASLLYQNQLYQNQISRIITPDQISNQSDGAR